MFLKQSLSQYSGHTHPWFWPEFSHCTPTFWSRNTMIFVLNTVVGNTVNTAYNCNICLFCVDPMMYIFCLDCCDIWIFFSGINQVIYNLKVKGRDKFPWLQKDLAQIKYFPTLICIWKHVHNCRKNQSSKALFIKSSACTPPPELSDCCFPQCWMNRSFNLTIITGLKTKCLGLSVC